MLDGGGTLTTGNTVLRCFVFLPILAPGNPRPHKLIGFSDQPSGNLDLWPQFVSEVVFSLHTAVFTGS